MLDAYYFSALDAGWLPIHMGGIICQIQMACLPCLAQSLLVCTRGYAISNSRAKREPTMLDLLCCTYLLYSTICLDKHKKNDEAFGLRLKTWGWPKNQPLNSFNVVRYGYNKSSCLSFMKNIGLLCSAFLCKYSLL